MAEEAATWPTTTEAARVICKSPTSLRRLAEAGRVRRVRDETGPTPVWRYSPESLDTYARANGGAGGGVGGPNGAAEVGDGALAARIARLRREGCTGPRIVEEVGAHPQVVAAHLRALAELEELDNDPTVVGRLDALADHVERRDLAYAEVEGRVHRLEREVTTLIALVRDALHPLR